LPKAQILARTLKRHHPETRFCVALAEPADTDLTAYEPAFDEVLTIDDLPLPDREAWVFEHSVVEICTAIKGYVMSLLLKRTGVDAVIYLDPDIAVFNRLTPVLDALTRSDVVLTPHLCEPDDDHQAILDNEVCALRHGVYNLGFLAVANRPEGVRFAEWWRDRLERYCFAEIARGLFADQRWADLVPAFFPTCAVIRHPGCNVATWNLARRRLEGDLERGFTVNGAPLIFYHFSGFDSGAQLAMLRRYAAGMPAAFLLRRWYVQETARVDARGYRRRRWRYGGFDNGAPVAHAQRQCYRERADLRQRFPHPFATAGDSFWAWCRSEAGPPRPPPARAGRTPLERHMYDRALARCSPYPWFDPDYYRQGNPDVVEGGWNPLLHYLRSGESEGRKPHPDFDPDFVRDGLPAAWGRQGSVLLDYELSGRTARVHPRFDPALDTPVVHRLRALLDPALPTVLHIGQEGSGGTSIHVQTNVRQMAPRANGILLAFCLQGRILVELPAAPGAPRLLFDRRSPPASLRDVLRFLGVQRLHVHHWLYGEDCLARLLQDLHLPYDVTLHDYYFLAPQPHLVDATGRFVGDGALDSPELRRPYWPELGEQDLGQWRRAGLAILNGAQRVVAPSGDLAQRYRRVFPTLAIHVAPHPETPRPEGLPVAPRACASDEPLRVVLLGHICLHKGRAVLHRCAELARAGGAPVEFHVLGKPDAPVAQSVLVHGLYTLEDLPGKLSAIRPHLAWFPAQCPESYSYTLSEAMRAGLPVLASNLGALPERLGGRAWSWLFPWDAAPEHWLDRLLQTRDRHFVRGEPAPGVGTPPRWDAEFYDQTYLDGIVTAADRRRHQP
jgi:glycosyltransferase involved in cell wall biosynthesis